MVRGGLGLGVRAVAVSSWPTAVARHGTGRRRRALMVVEQGLHANRAAAKLMASQAMASGGHGRRASGRREEVGRRGTRTRQEVA